MCRTLQELVSFCSSTPVAGVTRVWGPVTGCSETLLLPAGLEPDDFLCSASRQCPQVYNCSYLLCVLDPIPGGCNLEFDLEVDPNIYLDYTLVDIHIKFAPANLGYTRYVENFSALSKTFCPVFGQKAKTRPCCNS